MDELVFRLDSKLPVVELGLEIVDWSKSTNSRNGFGSREKPVEFFDASVESLGRSS